MSRIDLQLFFQNWLPRGDARAVVIIVHGFSDHCGRYENLVEGLVKRRLAVYSYDLRGHGRSPGQQGYIEHFDDYRQDTRTFVNFVSENHLDLPLFLFGHSMGGLIALDQALHYSEGLNGVIASAPHLGNPAAAPSTAGRRRRRSVCGFRAEDNSSHSLPGPLSSGWDRSEGEKKVE